MGNSKLNIAARAHLPGESGDQRCHVPGCGRPTQRTARQGLSELYCKVHVEFHRRHGSYWRRSYTASELGPYRTAARRWLRVHKGQDFLAQVVAALDGLMAGSGKPESAYDLRSLSADEKARIALARLREEGVTGTRFLEVSLAVSAMVAQQGPDDAEFREVQIAKAVHRLASGTHRSTSGFPMRAKYAHSAGRVLRVLGHRIWDIAALVADPTVVEEVGRSARPGVAAAKEKAARRQVATAAVAREIERLRGAGIGPERLANMRKELRRRHGLN